MERTEEKIIIHCVMSEEYFSRFSRVISKFHHGLKEEVSLQSCREGSAEDFIKEEGIYVIQDADSLPEPHYLYYKRCRLYLFTPNMADTEKWIKNVLLDGIILESGDTTVRSFLEDTIFHEYARNEDRYRKKIDEWLSAGGEIKSSQMLTVSFGRMRRIYNELKTFVEYRRLREKYAQEDTLRIYDDFVKALYGSDSAEVTEEKRKKINSAVLRIRDEEKKLLQNNVSTVSILLTGETGVGKSLLAEYFQLYFLGAAVSGQTRPNKLNCSHLTKEQIRTELFGAVKGSYTDQTQTIPGKILENVLKIFILDEIGDMDLELQPQILSYLDDSRVQLQNMDKSIYCPLIFIATTNRDIPSQIKRGDFRNDLYERFDLHLHIPPLRERREEIKPFIKSILAAESRRHPAVFKELYISKVLIEYLKTLDYRDGNFRELQRILRSAVSNCITQGGRIIKIAHLEEYRRFSI